MCGIAGIWGRSDESLIQNMMERIEHRGPDAEGIHRQKEYGTLGHRRLSIMDPQRGNQPIYNETKSAVVVANGEIYNFPELRAALSPHHQFQTTSDSEATVHLFEERGPELVNQLDGMFAFAIAHDDGLMLARDPIGIKPLYYGVQNAQTPNQTWYFASELKALADLEVDVQEFPPGVFYHSKQGWQSYYGIPERSPCPMSVEEAIRQVRRSLEEAVTKRLMSDVPLGAFLSGGLDSSLIAALARPHMDVLHTFSVGIEGSRDLEAARVVARHIDSIHHEYIYTPEEVRDALPEILYHLESFDQDLVRSAIPCHFCSRLASDYVKVILTGEGADELFAGYTYYREYDEAGALHRELRRSVGALHNVNLQRVDRLTMAHSIEGRVPFLDLNLIEMALEIPAELKLFGDDPAQRVEKWILRKACEDLLPREIVWRDKEQFDEGSGTVDMLDALLKECTRGFDSVAYTRHHASDRLRSPEEAFYHKILAESFGSSRVIFNNVGRWSERE